MKILHNEWEIDWRRCGFALVLLSLFLTAIPLQAENTMPSDKISIEEAFTLIGIEYGVHFNYDRAVVADVEVDYDSGRFEKMEDALQSVFSQTNLKYEVFDQRYVAVYRQDREGVESMKKMVSHFQEVISSSEEAYHRAERRVTPPLAPLSIKDIHSKRIVFSVSGIVTDQDGEPLIGVNIQVKGSDKGTSTDFDGRFVLEDISENAVLVVSYVGYQTQEIAVAGKSELEIVMTSDAELLEEVVVVGMNIRQTKRSVTGAMAGIETKELKQSPVANLNNALAGRLPGLITVQSTGEPGADASDLFIRGIGTYGSNRAPLIVVDGLPRGQGSFSQIDPNEVESVSILKDASSSALYGVQGANGVIVVTTKRGKSDKKNVIDYTSQIAMTQPIRLPESMDLYSSAIYFNESDENMDLTPRFSDEALQAIREGSDPFLYPNVDWLDAILKNHALQNQHNINLSGSSNSVRYFASASYLNQNTLLNHGDVFKSNYRMKPKFDRYNFRSNIDIEATKRLDLQIDLAGRLEERVGPSIGFGDVFSTISLLPKFAMPIYNPDGSLGNGSQFLHPYTPNPLGQITQGGYYQEFTNVLYGTLSGKYNLDFVTEGLSLQSYFSFENNNFKHTGRTQSFDSFWYRGVDQFKDPIYQQYQVYSRLTTSGHSSIERSNYFDVRLNYNRFIGRSDITAQLLANRTLRVLNDELPYAYQGISARLVYGFDDKLFLETNLGFNGSENFPPKNRYGFFPSLSLAWIMNDQNFMKKQEFVKYLKWRISYGVVGNDKIGGDRWLYMSDFAPGGGYTFDNAFNWSPGYNENRVGNYYVTWERSNKFNVGFDAEFLRNNNLTVSIDLFYDDRKDILTPPGSVPDYIGISNLAPRNSGRVINRGIDGEFQFNKKWTDIDFFINFNITYAKNKVLQNDQPPPKYSYQDLRGLPIGYELGYEFVGFFENESDISNSPKQRFSSKVIPGYLKYADYNNDGKVDSDDRIPIRVFNVPELMSGLSFGVSYKMFDLSFLFNGSAGGTIFRDHREMDIIQLDRWTPENKSNAKTVVASNAENNKQTTTFYVEHTDYLKLRNCEIANLGLICLKKWLIISMYLQGDFSSMDKIFG